MQTSYRLISRSAMLWASAAMFLIGMVPAHALDPIESVEPREANPSITVEQASRIKQQESPAGSLLPGKYNNGQPESGSPTSRESSTYREIPGKRPLSQTQGERSVGNYQDSNGYSAGLNLTVTLLPALGDSSKVQITVMAYDPKGQLQTADKGKYVLKAADNQGAITVIRLNPDGGGLLRANIDPSMAAAIKKDPTFSIVASGFERVYSNKGWNR